MSRAKWKGPYILNKLLEESKKNKLNEKYLSEIYTFSRASTIIPNFVGNTLNVHNGKTFSKIQITENMIGKKLGEFSPTRKTFSFKKKKIK
jgi:small subunit ribosomal protein S19|tara:strand:+ start:1456 stop:1728 length:273 start_codon:yes stop_codon:yes gene_type:complete